MTHQTIKSVPQPQRILGLVGSHRRLGNSELTIKEIWRHLPGKPSLNLIRLPALDIRPCHACYSCIMGEPCPIDDHMGFLRQQIAQSEALIIAAPVYFVGAHSIIKRILDRGFLFYGDAEQNAHKPCILVNLHGIEEKIGVAPQMLRALAATLCLDVKAHVSLNAALPGEVLANPQNLSLLRSLAGRMVCRKIAKHRSGCPFCGCEIVRMQNRAFICTLCHSSFTLTAKGEPVKGKKGWAIGTKKFVQEHTAWLRSMRDKYMENRKVLLRLSLPYKDIGTWLEPPKTSDQC